MSLERSRRGLQLLFRPRCDQTWQSGVMSSQSPGTPTRTISGLQLGSPKKKNHLDVASAERCRVNPLWGGRQQPHQSLEKLRKYKGGEQAPRNGSLALPKDAAVKPFSPKGKLNAILIVLSPILARRSNGLPGGHAHLRRSLPRLE